MNYFTPIVIAAFLYCTGIVSRALPVSSATLQPLAALGEETCTLRIRDHQNLPHSSSLRMRAVCEPKEECQAVVRKDPSDDTTYSFECIRRQDFSGHTALFATHLPENEIPTTGTRPMDWPLNKALSASLSEESELSRPSYSEENLAESRSQEEGPRPSYDNENNARGASNSESPSDESKSIVRRSRPSQNVPNRALDSTASSEERIIEWATNRADRKQQTRRGGPVDEVPNQAQSSGASRRSADYRPSEQVPNRAQGQNTQTARRHYETRRPYDEVKNRAQGHHRGHERPRHRTNSRRPSEERPNMANQHH